MGASAPGSAAAAGPEPRSATVRRRANWTRSNAWFIPSARAWVVLPREAIRGSHSFIAIQNPSAKCGLRFQGARPWHLAQRHGVSCTVAPSCRNGRWTSPNQRQNPHFGYFPSTFSDSCSIHEMGDWSPCPAPLARDGEIAMRIKACFLLRTIARDCPCVAMALLAGCHSPGPALEGLSGTPQPEVPAQSHYALVWFLDSVPMPD